LPNVPNAPRIFELAAEKKIKLSPPPKPMFEEKMLFALLWNRNLQNFWRQELGEGFLARLKNVIPYTWLVDPRRCRRTRRFPSLTSRTGSN
jgi:hypothetical protein